MIKLIKIDPLEYEIVSHWLIRPKYRHIVLLINNLTLTFDTSVCPIAPENGYSLPNYFNNCSYQIFFSIILK